MGKAFTLRKFPQILEIPAKEIKIGDSLGEGMTVWAFVDEKGRGITFYWGPTNAHSLLRKSTRTNTFFRHDEIVRVVRIVEVWEEVGTVLSTNLGV